MINDKEKIAHVIRVNDSKYPKALENSWSKAYPDINFKYPERFKWLHIENPLRKEFSCSLIFISENGIAASWTSAIYHKLNIDKFLVNASFSIDTYTLPEYRGKGYASMLKKMSIEETDCWWSISLSPANRRIYLRIGFYEGPVLSCYFKILRQLSKRNFIGGARNIFKNKSLLIRFGFSSNISLKFWYSAINLLLRRWIKQSAPIKEITFRKINVFGIETDKIWDEFKQDYVLSNDRNQIYLNWRYNQAPFVEYKKFLIYYKETAIGFFVYRVGDELQDFEAYIDEFVLLKEYLEYACQIIKEIERFVTNDGGKVIYMINSNRQYRECFEGGGFIEYDTFVPAIHFSESLKKRINIEKIVKEDSSWFISLGDQDLEQYCHKMMQPDFITLMNLLIEKVNPFRKR